LAKTHICLEKSLLRGVFGQLKITDQRIAVSHGHVLETADDFGKSLSLAFPNANDEISQIAQLLSPAIDRSQMKEPRLPVWLPGRVTIKG
jgi:hypothetical protein